MCGIVGYNGSRQAVPILIDSLERLEYRGYDSAGIAVFNSNKIEVYKDKGRIIDLKKSLAGISGTVGIGHTRWATHGRPNKVNAHPHTSGNIAVVHNGIIENYQELREKLSRAGYAFVSETDTEVLAHLINHNYKNNLKDAVISALKDIKGSYAIAVLCGPELVAARKDSPLIIGIGDGENFIASDVPAILKYTRRVIYLGDLEVASVTPEEVSVFGAGKTPIVKTITTIDWDLEAAEKSGYEHFMLKEIHEQPKALHETLAGRISELEGNIFLDGLNLTEKQVKELPRISIIACGTSFNAGLLGKYLFEQFAHIHVDVEIASEFRYAHSSPGSLVIVISQSGETADTITFTLPSAEKTEKFVARLKEKKLTTKNLPDAFSWHFAGTWNHMLPVLPAYKDRDLKCLWPKSYDLLKRTIALPVNIKMSDEQIEKIIRSVLEISKEVA